MTNYQQAFPLMGLLFKVSNTVCFPLHYKYRKKKIGKTTKNIIAFLIKNRFIIKLKFIFKMSKLYLFQLLIHRLTPPYNNYNGSWSLTKHLITFSCVFSQMKY